MISDRMFKEPVARAARYLASKNTSPVYFYEFGYKGKYSFADTISKVGHSEGLGKLILSPFSPNIILLDIITLLSHYFRGIARRRQYVCSQDHLWASTRQRRRREFDSTHGKHVVVIR